MPKRPGEIIGRATQLVIGTGLAIATIWLCAKSYDYWNSPSTPTGREAITADGLKAILVALCAVISGLIGAVMIVGAIVPASFWDRFVRPPKTGEVIETGERKLMWLWFNMFHH